MRVRTLLVSAAAAALVVSAARRSPTATITFSFAGDWTGTAVVAGPRGGTTTLSAQFTDTSARTFEGTLARPSGTTGLVTCTIHGRRHGRRVSFRASCDDGSHATATGVLDLATQTLTGAFHSGSGKRAVRGTLALAKVPSTTTTSSSTSTTVSTSTSSTLAST